MAPRGTVRSGHVLGGQEAQAAPSDPRRTVNCPMSWTIRPLDTHAATTLAAELGVTETTARVLIRRGFADADAARAFLEGALPGHDPFALGDMRGRRASAIRAAVAAGERICVHGDYDADGICATALAVLLLRELGADADVAPAVALRGGLRPRAETIARLAAEGVELVLTVDCGITAVAEVDEARAARPRRRRHRPPPPGRDVPDCPVVAPLEGRLPVRRPLRHRRRLEARRGAARPGPSVPRPAPRRRRARDGRRRRAARRREPRARAARACAALAQTQKPGLRALMRVARRRPGRAATRARSASGSRRGSTPPAGSAGREAALELLLDRRRGRGHAARRASSRS